jgi:hypothetical protein
MTDIAARFKKIAVAFTARVEAVPADSWKRRRRARAGSLGRY